MKNLTPAVLNHDVYWAIEPRAAESLLAQIGAVDAETHRAQFQADREARIAQLGEARENKPYQMYGSTAIIDYSGPMTKKGSSFGGGGTTEMRSMIRKAANDADVRSILLIWDSPGGSVSGTDDLAADIEAASRKKQVVSYIEDQCCSAALWCAVQASAVYANSETACIGSIGVFSYAVDMSQYAEDMGIKVHLLTTGKFKGAGAVDGVPITEEQLAEMQSAVDKLGDSFIGAVSRGRDMSRADVEDLADGRVWWGSEAVKVGLIDAVMPMDDVLLSLNPAAKGRGARAEADTTISASADSPAPTAGTQLRTDLKTALTAGVEAVAAMHLATTRAGAIKGIREKQGRAYSPQTLEMVRELSSLAIEVSAQATALLTECEALGHDTPVADAPAVPDPAEAEAIAALKAARDKAAAVLAAR
jgi:signal peptide peptidase SppA